MGPEAIAYPFLFVAIFFESFVLVTLLSSPAREARRRSPTKADEVLPSVAVIVPCWNEAATLATTCDSLLALDYPKERLEVILVNDGSTDQTQEAMERYKAHPQVRIIQKENGGKHTALNAALKVTDAEFIGCLDADSRVERESLRQIIPCFADPEVGAVTAAMSVDRPRSIFQHMQYAEYIFGITLSHSISSVNGLYVTPGPFSFYRHSVLKQVGDFRYGHQTEDMEMALRIQQAGYKIDNAMRARVYTRAPDTLIKLMRQRTRWTSGFLRNVFGEYRDLLGKRKYGVLGLLVLPIALLTIGGGMLLFFVMLYQLAQHTATALSVRAGIPLSYALLPHGQFDWFYFPASVYLFLGITTIMASLILVAVGKRISQAPGKLAFGLVSYALLYGLVAPLWLIRATSDVALGIRRGWRY